MDEASETTLYKKRFSILLSLLILFFYSSILALTPDERLSPDAQISIITCTPAPQLYALFGHCAIRIHDPEKHIDIVYNYGTFDFNDPNFYVNFARGKLKYFLSTQAYDYFVYQYRMNRQSITEQVLHLTQAQKNRIFHFLMNNLLPENRYYSYDFFFDNCATRIRDVIQEAFNHHIRWHSPSDAESPSYRQLIAPYLRHVPWVHLGINLLLGIRTDGTTSMYEQTFLPDYLYLAIHHTQHTGPDGPFFLENSTNKIFEAPDFRNPPPLFFHPFTVFSLLFLLIILLSWFEYRGKFRLLWVDRILFGLVGFLGIFIVIMWCFSQHRVVNWNLNLLWALPSHILVAFFVSSKKIPHFVQAYMLITALWSTAIVISWYLLPQELPWPIIPLLLTLTVRSYFSYFRLKNSE
jgi:hypothetical protein